MSSDDPYEAIERQCLMTLAAVRDLISDEQYRDTDELIAAGEYGIGLGILIDWLCEDKIRITPAQFAEFKKAAGLMAMPDDINLASLKKHCMIH